MSRNETSQASVKRAGGRPALTPKAVQDQLTMLAESTRR